jgi:hypothetical protein
MTTDSPEHFSQALQADPESLVVDIVTRVAAARDISPYDLPPLTDYVEADALVRLVAVANRGGQQVTAQFRYDQHDVRVRGDGSVELTAVPAAAGGDAE